MHCGIKRLLFPYTFIDRSWKILSYIQVVDQHLFRRNILELSLSQSENKKEIKSNILLQYYLFIICQFI